MSKGLERVWKNSFKRKLSASPAANAIYSPHKQVNSQQKAPNTQKRCYAKIEIEAIEHGESETTWKIKK